MAVMNPNTMPSSVRARQHALADEDRDGDEHRRDVQELPDHRRVHAVDAR
jgi:hypothetical protein